MLARIIFELDTAVDNYGSLTLRRSNTAIEPCVVAIQWKLVLLKIRKRKWFKCRVNFYFNSDATFNVMELCIERSGDVHPMPGPNDNCTSEIPVRISSRYRGYKNGNLRLKGTSLYNRNMTNLTMIQRLAHCLPKVTTCCLKFCLMNTRSVRNKTMVVKDFAVDHDVDILALTETWLRPGNIDDIDVGALCPTGCRFLHVPRSQGRGGGVGVLFKDSLDVNTSVTVSFETFEFMNVRLRNCQSVRILFVYRPPNNTSCALFFDEFSRLLEHVLSQPSASLMIAGDLNFHMENSNNALTRQFIEILETFDPKQHVLSATHASGHTLALLITRSNEELVRNVKIHDPMISDHLAVFCNLSLKKP